VKVLFLHHNQPDYLAESLFHGLRSILGKDCVDVPRYDSMYAPLTDNMRAKLRGNGFTMYGLLEDIPELAEDRFFWGKDLELYDLIVIADIWTQWELFWKLCSLVPFDRLVVIDSHDIPAFFPYASLGHRLRNIPWSYLTPVSKVKYFKRELIGEGAAYSLDRFLPRSLRQWISFPENAQCISFSIPEEKISLVQTTDKTKDFPIHIVDREVAEKIKNSFHSETGTDRYSFVSESDYYEDLKKSRFGITTKRAGWDCLRHYELAANGCVLCFRDLNTKAESCAPHGLNASNSISYRNFDELTNKLSSLTDQDYAILQENTYQWIRENTTISSAKKFINTCIEK
jgi:hypothetical protein